MADENPTIPQIVRALTTLEDRHADELRKLTDAFDKQLKCKQSSLESVDSVFERRTQEISFLKDVIEDLCGRIERTQQQLKRDNQQCVYSEPMDLMYLLGRETDPVKVIQEARDKRRTAKARKAEPEPCGKQIDFGPNQNAEPCTRTKDHPGYCIANADDVPASQEVEERLCRICGHSEDRHTHTLPEEGRKPYCAECDWADENHAFDGALPSREDVCNCGHLRGEHSGETSMGGAQCGRCPGDEERSWRHEFMMKTGG